MSLISKKFADELINEKEMRDAYLAAQTRTYLAAQIRTNRANRKWSQGEFAQKLDTSQSAVSRMEDRQYGKLSLQSLLEVASIFDCGLLVQFVPYADFVRSTENMSSSNLSVPEFDAASLAPLCRESTPTLLAPIIQSATAYAGIETHYIQGSASFGGTIFVSSSVTQGRFGGFWPNYDRTNATIKGTRLKSDQPRPNEARIVPAMVGQHEVPPVPSDSVQGLIPSVPA